MPEPSAILAAAKAGELDAVREMLRATPALANAAGTYGRTLLHEAAERDDRPLAELVLDAGADPERETEWGDTPLEWAAVLGARAVADLLLARGARRYDLLVAAGVGRERDVRQFLASSDTGEHDRPRPRREDAARTTGWYPACARLRGDAVSDAFVLACRNGHTAIARQLVDAGADPAARGYFGAPAMHWAAHYGHADTVTFLLTIGADPAVRDPAFDADAAGWAREGGFPELAAQLERGP